MIVFSVLTRSVNGTMALALNPAGSFVRPRDSFCGSQSDHQKVSCATYHLREVDPQLEIYLLKNNS